MIYILDHWLSVPEPFNIFVTVNIVVLSVYLNGFRTCKHHNGGIRNDILKKESKA